MQIQIAADDIVDGALQAAPGLDHEPAPQGAIVCWRRPVSRGDRHTEARIVANIEQDIALPEGLTRQENNDEADEKGRETQAGSKHGTTP
ncbi:hypothetical protein MACH15_27390 [Maricaulis maris]|nr:hypothetical protein MACH15_27390 [Maricaulis maris]